VTVWQTLPSSAKTKMSPCFSAYSGHPQKILKRTFKHRNLKLATKHQTGMCMNCIL